MGENLIRLVLLCYLTSAFNIATVTLQKVESRDREFLFRASCLSWIHAPDIFFAFTIIRLVSKKLCWAS